MPSRKFTNLITTAPLLLTMASCSIDEHIVDKYKNIIEFDNLLYSNYHTTCAVKIYKINSEYQISAVNKKIFSDKKISGDPLSFLILSARNCVDDINMSTTMTRTISDEGSLHVYHRLENTLVVYNQNHRIIYFLRGEHD
jgi:hypothetical protein